MKLMETVTRIFDCKEKLNLKGEELTKIIMGIFVIKKSRNLNG